MFDCEESINNHITHPLISKKSISIYQKCSKLFYYLIHQGIQVPDDNYADPDTGNLGQEALRLFRSRFPDGIYVEEKTPHSESVQITLELIKKRNTVFNAVLKTDNIAAHIDVLLPVGQDKWDIYTVKCSMGVKNSHLFDSAFIYHIAQKNRIKIRSCKSVSINPEYIREKELDVYRLFRISDVSSEAGRLFGWVNRTLKEMNKVLCQKNPPKTEIGAKCFKRFDCPMMDKCWSSIPERSVYLLTGSDRWTLAKQLTHSGYALLKDIPDTMQLTEKQKIQVACEKKMKPHIERGELRKFLSGLKYPYYFIDFEAMINMVVPVYENTSPFQQIPFQFSLHVLNSPESQPEHFFYLSKGNSDPRFDMIPLLMKYLGGSGSIIAYNTDFEKKVFRELADLDADFARWYSENSGRFVDLMQPFKAFYYYHPFQDGKISLKKVLPVLTDISYSGLDIMDAVTAAEEYMRITFGDMSETEKEKSRDYLLKYGTQDTLALHRIIQALFQIAEESGTNK